MSGMFKQGASSFELFSWKSSFCFRVFFNITQVNTHNHCMLPAKICAIHGDNLSFFILSLLWHLQWTIVFHGFPGCFFVIFIQLCDSRKIHYLSLQFRVKLHLKTDIALIAKILVFACNLIPSSGNEFSYRISMTYKMLSVRFQWLKVHMNSGKQVFNIPLWILVTSCQITFDIKS